MLFSTEQTEQSGRLSGHCDRPETEKDKHQLSDHSLTIETGGQTWQPRENREENRVSFLPTARDRQRAKLPAMLQQRLQGNKNQVLHQNKTKIQFLGYIQKNSGIEYRSSIICQKNVTA